MDRMSAIPKPDPIDEWGIESFPASDPPSWAAATVGSPRHDRIAPRDKVECTHAAPVRPKVRVYRPAKSATQSGLANTRRWRIDFVPSRRPFHDGLMGWIGTADPRHGLRLEFPSREAAVAFAERQGWDYEVIEPHERRLQPKTYAANFQWDDPALQCRQTIGPAAA